MESDNPMLLLHNIRLDLDHREEELAAEAARRLGISKGELVDVSIFKRSVDARRENAIKLVYSLLVEVEDEEVLSHKIARDSRVRPAPDTSYRLVTRARGEDVERPLVVGMGPAGLFAGLVLAEMGFRPLLIERGKKVRERAVDTFEFWREGRLNPESNVQFGEGGAGTFSDGKLNTRISDQANRDRKVLRELVRAGAPAEILYLNKPHIGTLRLVKILQNMRERIQSLGGRHRYQSRVVDVLLEDGRVRGVRLEGEEEILARHVILAVGHSARDTFRMLRERGAALEPKPFSIGLRIEHPQALIDRQQYGEQAGHPRLGAADYQLVHHGSHGRSVYTFCMCPGGTVLAAASELETVVTNGMSEYGRNAVNANSAVVCEVSPRDYPGGSLQGIAFQRRWEEEAFKAGGGDYRAPAQLVGDFLAGRASTSLGAVEPTYQPGVRPADLRACLPGYVAAAIREALPAFENKIRGFAMDESVLTGVETRTSSPVRILRGEDYQSVSLPGLYPAGEGAGYAGGILSSAVDGIRAAEAVALSITGD